MKYYKKHLQECLVWMEVDEDGEEDWWQVESKKMLEPVVFKMY